ncbi:MAG: dethiobiotin synthase [Sphingomonadaceae bacterium]
MTIRLVVSGTDTGIGKTVLAAGLTGALGATYWKPVQAGIEEESDAEAVVRLSGRPVLPEVYSLQTPCSPHEAAAIDGVAIDPARLALPQVDGPLVVEGAGGVLVPLSDDLLYADLFARWGLPVVLAARTALGTINHSLLSIEALRARNVPIAGIAFIGDENAETQRVICHIGKVRNLGRLPLLDPLNAQTLAEAMAGFDLDVLGDAE